MGNSDDGDNLFRDLMGDVRPLKSDKAEIERPRPKPKARFRRAGEADELGESISDATAPDTHEELSFARPGISQPVLRKLRRGRYSIGAELDLHGLTARSAQHALEEFLAECVAEGHGCVRVIHGKGTRSGHRGPVLKPAVARWLRRFDCVLAYTSARPVDGGSGALYVLLRD